MYPLIAKWTILPGNEKKATAALKKLALDVKKNEPGTLLYMVYKPNFKATSLPTPPENEIIFFEIYEDQPAFIKHITGPAYTDFVKNYGDLFLHDFNTPPQIFMTTEALALVGGFASNNLK
jgi:quinol monooxygenase YgiN